MTIRIQNFKQSPVDFMRSCGYAFDREVGPVKPNGHGASAEASCMRRLTGHDYPRYHAYVKKDGTALIVNLHIDQGKPSYGSNHAHNGEYEGELVEREVERIRGFAEQAE